MKCRVAADAVPAQQVVKAQVLGIKKGTASQRYIRALKRLKEILSSIPGLGANP